MADTDREEWHVKVNVQEAASVLGCGKLMMCIVVSIPPIVLSEFFLETTQNGNRVDGFVMDWSKKKGKIYRMKIGLWNYSLNIQI